MVGNDMMPWSEKYRPQKVAQVAHQDEVVRMLSSALDDGQGNLPHLLFYGPPGTGKTSTALALCRQMFGAQHFKARVLELNASDERGIKVVRDRIKTFAQTSVPEGRITNKETGRAVPAFKIIILDEADAITTDAQTALRRTMETFSLTTRFILICNYISRIIAPLASRCAKCRFMPLPMSAMRAHLSHIASGEGLSISTQLLDHMCEASEGDMRRAITTLQSTSRMAGPGGDMDDEALVTAACLVPESVLDDFEAAVLGSCSFKDMSLVLTNIVDDGYSVSQLILQFGRRIQENTRASIAGLSDLQKSAVVLKLAEAEAQMIDGADEWLQLQDIGGRLRETVQCATNQGSLRHTIQSV
ncbi:Replication factor C subunit 2 [Porphyridium purpureum]|uniref:Replication factor C subunit 2 n=1 Tax=Porphyridium purpureum TaxID=35688 RepID=A0A5J4YXB4_PORPP|nr:Replication factor C subunit 2 [Porphyridium purpureum]|eukprot:POR6713..scf209_3